MNNLKITFSVLGICIAFVLVAQPPPPPATPIDGGLSFLLAGGAAFGIKKIYDLRKR